MNKTDFIEMCKRDAGDNPVQLAIVDLFDEIIPSNVEIDGNKNPGDFYKEIKKFASDNRKGSSYCITPVKAKELAIKYLNIEVKEKESFINLEDFF